MLTEAPMRLIALDLICPKILRLPNLNWRIVFIAMCRKILAEDDVPEEEIQDEICCIRLQKAYCQQLLGKTEEAFKAYADVSKKKPSDVSLIAVASNNFVSIKKESNLFDARKKMKSCQNAQIQQKLNRKQKGIICYNSILVNLHSNQLETSRKLIDELKNYYKAHELSLLCEAVLLSKQKDASVAIRELENYYKEKGEQCSLEIYYTLLQLYLNEGMTTQAINALQSLDRLKTSPGLLSILVSLFLVNNDRKSASDLLKLSIDEFEKLPAKKSIIPNLLEEGSAMYISANDFKSAAKYLEDLLETNPNDPKIIARLINAYLRFDHTKAEK
uniref:Uncharacterized protein n=1 Tax=Romanomermis culicivorax TaxID=13658 RepID=A0A915IZR5_ROMCU